MPDVGNMDVESALAVLAPLQLRVDVVRGYHPEVREGTVVRQEPGPGSLVRVDRRVLLHVSSGSPPVVVPDVVGLPLVAASNRLGRSGLVSIGRGGGFPSEIRAEIADDSRPPGTVLEQDPTAGSLHPLGETVYLVVSAGPKGFGKWLSDLRGRTLADAESVLASLGVGAIETVEVPVEEARSGLVVGQAPPPGTPVRDAPSVRLEIGVGVAPEAERRATIIYAAPGGETLPGEVIIRVEDSTGEREVYRGKPAPGAQVSVPVKVVGAAWARIYVAGSLKDGWPI